MTLSGLNSNAGNIPAASSDTRINGKGSSVLLNVQPDADQYFESTGVPMPANGITFGAWISLKRDDLLSDAGPVTWPIVSTIGDSDSSCGYQLDIGSNGKGLELVFTYAYAEQNGTCTRQQLKSVLTDPSWAWGLGRWHHVAGSYTLSNTGERIMTLHSNGNLIATRTIQASPPNTSGDQTATLYIGTEASATAPGTAKYKGYIDDVAIFNRSLSESELSEFVEQSSTTSGPSGCQWQADEAWDFVNPSTATLSEADLDGSLLLTVNDRDWGYARLRAHLTPHLDLSRLNVACLDATIKPANATFEFGLNSGDGYCIWFLDKAHRVPCGPTSSNQNSYEIDLTNPNYCQATTCAFNINDVQEAWIASDWGSAEDKVRFAVRGLAFGRSEKNIDYPSSYGGAIGPLGWCWRPQSTNPGTSASWASDSPPTTRAQLKGPANSTVRLVADFADGWVDLSQCATVRLEALLPGGPAPSGCQYAFVLIDVHGAQFQVLITNPARPLNIPLSRTGSSVWMSDYSFDSEHNGEFKNVPYFDLKRVRLLGIQKNYQAPCEADVAISDVRFLGPDGQENCAD